MSIATLLKTTKRRNCPFTIIITTTKIIKKSKTNAKLQKKSKLGTLKMHQFNNYPVSLLSFPMFIPF